MKQARIIIVAILLSTFIVTQAPVTAVDTNATTGVDNADWPEVGYDLANTGHTPASSGPESAVNVTWAVDVDSWVRSTVVVQEGTAYATSEDGTLYAIDTTSGEINWRVNRSVSGATEPVVAGNLIISRDDSGTYAVYASNGTISWESPAGAGDFAAPAVSNQTVYTVNSDDERLQALDVSTGDVLWNTSLGAGYRTTHPAIRGDTAYVTLGDSLYAINLTTHNKEWVRTTNAPIAGAPTVTSSGVYVTTSEENSSVVAYSLTGQKRWARQTGGYSIASPTVAHGTVYIGDTYGAVFAINAADGSVDWKYTKGDGWFLNSVVAANNTIYAAGERGTIYALSPENGTERWRTTIAPESSAQIEESPPVVVNQSIYITTIGNAGDQSAEVGQILRLDSGTETQPQPTPITGTTPPTDPDNDGIYEDVNGDNTFDIVDVNAFFQNRQSSAVQDNPTQFDFNGDGTVNIVDVNLLFQNSQA